MTLILNGKTFEVFEEKKLQLSAKDFPLLTDVNSSDKQGLTLMSSNWKVYVKGY
jgi:hypothetical protein